MNIVNLNLLSTSFFFLSQKFRQSQFDDSGKINVINSDYLQVNTDNFTKDPSFHKKLCLLLEKLRDRMTPKQPDDILKLSKIWFENGDANFVF